MTGLLLTKGAATLHEMQTVYSYEDALNMVEAIQVRNYNQWAAVEAAKRERNTI